MWIEDLPTYLVALTPARLVFWPALGGAGATLAVAVRDGRRRTTLNECLHELRRPLQALVLAPGAAEREGVDGAGAMAAAALARLEREINGAAIEAARTREAIAARPLLEAAARRWRAQAAMRGKCLELRWDADEAVVEGERIALAAALDNLLANALEHGGERIELAADLVDERLCLAVVDSGRGAGRRARDREAVLRGRAAKRRRGRAPLGWLSGKSRHGHGLRLVHRTAASHDGSFALHQGEHGTSAVLELPLAARRIPGARSQARRDDPERTSTLFVSEGSSRRAPRKGTR
jgi:signal transduction histidine kinase